MLDGAFDNDEKKLLKIPDDFDVMAATPLGYSSDDLFKALANRKLLNKIISTDKV